MGWGRAYYGTCQTRSGHALVRAAVRMARRIGYMRDFRMPLDALELDHNAVAGLMRLWSRIHWNCGDGMMPAEELLAVYRMAVTWPVDGDVVELGSWVGLTTSYLATACVARGSGCVHAVDTFQGTKEGGAVYPSIERFGGNTLEAFRDQVRRAGVEERIDVHVGLTSNVAEQYGGRAIRVLLIDADHSYEGVRADFRDWFRHVAPGGLILFHDYKMPEIARFIEHELGADLRVALAPGEVLPNLYAVTKRPAKAPALVFGERRCDVREVALSSVNMAST